MLAFETMETPFINTVEKAVYWVNKVNSPYLAVYPDLGNMLTHLTSNFTFSTKCG